MLPGAYAGSVCGRRLSGKPSSTIGFEKRHNEAFRIEDEAEFVRVHARRDSAGAARGRADQSRQLRRYGRRGLTHDEAAPVRQPASPIRLGLKENWQQFALLVLINAFVGGMVGIERTVVPLIGSEEFGIASTTLVVSFIVSFGVVKAFANLVSGQLADAWGRKRVLVLGWLFGLPVPFMIIWAPSWGWVIAANALLGINQGLRLVDDGDHEDRSRRAEVARPRRRPQRVRRLSCGRRDRVPHRLSRRAIRPAPGADLSRHRLRDPWARRCRSCWCATRATMSGWKPSAHAQQSAPISFREVFALTSFRDRNLFAASQAGLVNNLNDGMSWGIFPLFFASFGLGVERIGILKAIYPATWGILQIATGPLSDRWGRKGLIVAGMWVQAAGLFLTAATRQFEWWLVGSLLLGLGTAMVYPSLIAAVSDASHPTWRARSLSVYRFWRDLGYAIGAVGGPHRGHLRSLVCDRINSRVDVCFWNSGSGRHEGSESAMTTPPILRGKAHDAPSVFTADALLREARRQKRIEQWQCPGSLLPRSRWRHSSSFERHQAGQGEQRNGLVIIRSYIASTVMAHLDLGRVAADEVVHRLRRRQLGSPAAARRRRRR